MIKISPLARRIAQRDARHRVSDALQSKEKTLIAEGQTHLEQGHRCGHLVVMNATAMTAPSPISG